MSESTSPERDAKVQIRFVIEPFEIGIETGTKESQAGAAIAGLIEAVQSRQEEITTAISHIDISKFKPIKRKSVIEAEDPLEKVALKLGVAIDEVKKMFLVEANKAFIVCKKSLFGSRGPGEKAALAILYIYRYGFDRSPTYEEINEAYQKLQFKPRSFGGIAKGNLLAAQKIAEDKKGRTITIEPRAILEAETIIRQVLSKL